MKNHLLIHPDVDPPRRRTAELVDELARLWREGRLEGAGEIGAIADLFSTPDLLPDVFKIAPGNPIHRFLLDALRFVQEGPGTPPAWLARIVQARGWEEIPLSVVGVGSATGALYAALASGGVAGGEVITASLNYVGVPNAAVMAGATPRFADIDPRTWCLDPASAARLVTKRTRAIVLTHLNAFADLEPWEELFERRGFDFPLIQDASLAIASTRGGVRPGLVNVGPGGVTIMSLTVSKILSGLGGAIAFANDPEALERVYTMAHQGVSEGDGAGIATFGTNCKMSALNAALAHEQFKRRDGIIGRRQELRLLYEQELAPLTEGGQLGLQALSDEDVVTHFGVLLPVPRKAIEQRLWEEHRVQLGMWHVHHREELYRSVFRCDGRRLPVTEEFADRLAFLPFHTMLEDEDVKAICGALAGELAGARKARPSQRPRKAERPASAGRARSRAGRSPQRKRRAQAKR